MPQIAKVAVAAATYAIDKPYDYLVPQGADMAVGMRVLVPFGRGNRVSEGVVLTLGQGVPEKPIKPIRSLVDREPVITEREIRLALWMRERYFCTFYDAIRTILPAAVWYSYREMWSLTGEPLPEDLSERETAACRLLQDGPMERDDLCAALGETGSRVLSGLKKRGILQMEPQGTRKVQDKVVQIAALSLAPQEALRQMERKKKSAARQYDAVSFLAKYGDAPVQELCYYTGVSRQGVRSLERAGLLSLRSQEEYRITRQDYAAAAEEIRLNDEQQRAYEAVLAQTRSGCPGVTLLQGVTGSGKTEVFLQCAERVIAQGGQVIYLVPEITLTHQLAVQVMERFKNNVAILHSGLTDSQRIAQWRRIKRSEVSLVIGARSAVFAPCENLRMIIIDEEHENSYKSGNDPRYHARQVAQKRIADCHGKLLMGSATPSLEAWHLMKDPSRMTRIDLTSRVGGGCMPKVEIADMTHEDGIFGKTLQLEMARTLGAGKQVILFLNRRGYSYYFHCRSCGYELKCPHCDVAMTYHKKTGTLKCHYCGYTQKPTRVCPVCGSLDVMYSGFGTEQVEQEVQRLFPQYRTARLDTDVVSKDRKIIQKTLDEFRAGSLDILIGTQMVAKGLNFPNVQLVGIVLADSGLLVPDFRAEERTFDLLVQVAGRSGRAGSWSRLA